MKTTKITNTHLYSVFYDQHPQPALILDSGVLIDCNQAACELLRLTDKAAVLGQAVEDVFDDYGFCSKTWLQRHLDLKVLQGIAGLIEQVSVAIPLTKSFQGSYQCHFKPVHGVPGLCYVFLEQRLDQRGQLDSDQHELQLGNRQIKLSCDELITFVSTLFLHFEVGIKVYELDSRNIVAANQTLLDMLGYNEAELIGLPVDVLLPDSERDTHEQATQRLLEQGYHDAYHKRLRAAEGGLFAVSVLGSIISELHHRRYVWTFMTNLTAVEEQNHQLLKREQRLNFAQKQSKMGNWEYDLVNDKLYWSDQVYRIFELDKNKVKPSYSLFLEKVYPDDREAVNSAYRQSLIDKTPYSIRHRLLMPDGRIKYVYENCQTEFDEQGNALLSLGTIQDITVSHQAQQELANLARIVQTSKDFIGMATPDGRISFINDAGRDMIQFSGNLVTQPWYIADLYTEAEQKKITQELIPLLMEKGVWRGELKMKVAGSEDQSVLTFCDCFRIDDHLSGQPLYLACVSQNITEKRAAELRLEAYQNQLENLVEQRTRDLIIAREEAVSANRAKSEFLSRVSHELRTPLNAVLGFAQILSYELDPANPVQRDHIQEILGAGNHLLDMINAILDLSEIEIGKIDLDCKLYFLRELLDTSLQEFNQLHPSQSVPLTVIDCDDSQITTDQKRFSQVFNNVLSNAIKFSTGKPNILISTRDDGEQHIQVRILNTALHLTEEQLKQAFLPFERLSESFDLVRGSGVGLALSKELVQCLGGTIWLEHDENQGTVCIIRLPKERLQEPTAAKTLPQQAEKKPYTLLYIEDNETNITLMRRFLAKFPEFNLLEARSAREGFQLLEQTLPDLILLDLSLPDQDGVMVYKMLRNTERTSMLPVIAVTANAMSHDARLYQQLGFDDCFFKPLNYMKLIEGIHKLLVNH